MRRAARPVRRRMTVSSIGVVRGRSKGMWWGTAIEAPDPGALAAFYLLDPAGRPFCLCRDDQD